MSRARTLANDESMSTKPYAFADRWRVSGTFTTETPLHVGSGTTVERDELRTGSDESSDRCRAQATMLDHYGTRACIPGSAIKGVLRAWAKRFVRGADTTVARLLGDTDLSQNGASAGRAEFFAAFVSRRAPMTHTPPYWCDTRGTGILSHVSINRNTGAAEAEKLYFEEYVPPQTQFAVEISLTGVSQQEVGFLLALLRDSTSHATHRLQFGANGANNWGVVSWSLGSVTRIQASSLTLAALLNPTQLPSGARLVNVVPASLTLEAPATVYFTVDLSFNGPFLVNDCSRARIRVESEDDINDDPQDGTNFVPLKNHEGKTWLPASSFRGALRERAELILRTLDAAQGGDPHLKREPGDADGPIERLFGSTSHVSRIVINEFVEIKTYGERRQELVAIDRFTGAAAEGAKFNAQFVDRPQLRTYLRIDKVGLEPQDVGLLALALRDMVRGQVRFGFGGSKGYGWATASLDAAGQKWLSEQIHFPSAQRDAVVSAAVFAAASNVIEGDLVQVDTREGKKLRLVFHNRRGVKVQPTPFDEKELAPSLRQAKAFPVAVHFETEGNRHLRIRPAGEPWGTLTSASQSTAATDGRFHHPYYFLRMNDREGLKTELGDSVPAPHRRLHPDRYSGTIRVRLTTKTPLLICDDESKVTIGEGKHKHTIYTVRRVAGEEGIPLLASSSVRGMLRSAYEAVTNSRLSVFPGCLATNELPAKAHGRRLGFRMQARADLVPVRIVTGGGGLDAHLLEGSGRNSGPLPAAWCGLYDTWKPATGFRHGEEVWAYLTPWHYSAVKNGKLIQFDFWNVEELRSGELPTPPPPAPANLRPERSSAKRATWSTAGWHKGYVCITNLNMKGKHDERLFFSMAAPLVLPIDARLHNQWRELIANYQEEHKRERKNGVTGPSALGNRYVFSRHVTGGPSERKLKHGDLCYAELGVGRSIKALYPVMIPRTLYDASPLEALAMSLRPATRLEELSPADRVFGWVGRDRTSGKETSVAHRSNVAIGPVRCCSDGAIETFEAPRPLAILGQPKPAQGRFYVGNSRGAAQSRDAKKEDSGYNGRNRVRGIKVYPHQQSFNANHADPSAQWIRRPDVDKDGKVGPVQDNQNRSIKDWVKPNTVFEFDVTATNLSRAELGALAWLLSLPDHHYLRLGLAKPLGFGSVRAEIVSEQTVMASGATWATYYAGGGTALPECIDLVGTVATFEALIQPFNRTLLTSFKKMATGFSGDVHYPLTKEQEVGSGKHFEWFGRNEAGARHSLPDIDDSDCSLPRL